MALFRPGDAVAAARRVPGAADAVSGAIDVTAALGWRDELVSHWDDGGQLPWLEERHVTLVRGTGRLAGERVVDVTAADGSVRRLTAGRAVVLATGTAAVIPPIPGLAEARPWDNRSVTAAKDIPRRLVVLGGGAIGAEMAQAMRRLGSEEVTVVEGLDRLLAKEEPFASRQVREAFEAEGIRVITGARMTAVERPAGAAPLRATLEGGAVVEADEILVAVGRRPRTDDLGLETVGLEPGKPVEVDERLRATGVGGGWLFAVGDCNGLALFTHIGKYQARVAADVILGKEITDRASRDVVPRVTFTDPQVCAVGLTEAQAKERGLDVKAVDHPTGGVAGGSVTARDFAGTSRLVVDERRRVIVGATFTGPGTADLLHSVTVAIAGEVPLERLWHAVPTFPTVSEVWLRLLEAYGL
jgi:dihydrolipoamide dehydrogenase